jgi:hypothetical protein
MRDGLKGGETRPYKGCNRLSGVQPSLAQGDQRDYGIGTQAHAALAAQVFPCAIGLEPIGQRGDEPEPFTINVARARAISR